MVDELEQTKSNSVLVVGGGIAGIKASLDLAEAGRKVYIIDTSPSLGGYLPLLDRQFPTNDCQICFLSPELAKTGYDLDIEVLPLTRITNLSGEAGDFTASIETQPRYINTDLCTACGDCVEAAPNGAVSYTPGLDTQSPTCMRYPQAIPQAYSIDKAKLDKNPDWTKVCEAGAIELDQEPSQQDIQIGAVILASGADLFDPSTLDQMGYGQFEDVITSLEFERIMSEAGPTGGRFARPSDGKEPKRIGWVQCVGSRSVREPAKPYCSSVCCMFAMKEAIWAKEHFADDLEATVFYMDMRAMGKDYEQYYQRAKKELDVNFVRCRPHSIERDPETKELRLVHAGDDGQVTETRLDMLVLATGFVAPCDAKQTADALGIELDHYNFVGAEDFSPVATSKPGVYACGMSLGPRDIPDSVMQASAAAAQASGELGAPKGIIPQGKLPPERDVRGEAPKVGVFLSDFGGTVKHVIDFGLVKKSLEAYDGVDYVEELEYLWTADGLKKMKAAIKNNRLNRVVVAGCSLRAHGPIFANAVRDTGLNKAYLEMANIREQDAWVHSGDPGVATTKAIDLIRMSVAHAKAAQPIYPYRQEIDQTALVVGGGVAGMSAALSLAGQGVKVHLVERGKRLGGMALDLQRALDGSPVAPHVKDMVEKVEASDNIEVIKEAFVVDHSGELGSFVTGVQSGPAMYYQEIVHGITILATGAKSYQPTEYCYGESSKVMTSHQFEQLLAKGDGSDDALNTVVMIQCVGSRNDENPACGRICCRSAVKHINWLKELKPESQVFVLYRDMRMPYKSEDAYREAREAGVLFIRYEPDEPPTVTNDDGKLSVSFVDPILGQPLAVEPSALVLSVPQIALNEDNEELAHLFHLQRSETGFLMEDHIKWKPVDAPTPGIFMAGSVLAPKSLNEAVTQGLAAAGRALTVLAQHSKSKDMGVAKVIPERCAACLVCVRACPFEVPFINADGYSEIDPAKCLGCGICAAECPAKAIQLQGFSDDQILESTNALLEGVL